MIPAIGFVPGRRRRHARPCLHCAWIIEIGRGLPSADNLGNRCPWRDGCPPGRNGLQTIKLPPSLRKKREGGSERPCDSVDIPRSRFGFDSLSSGSVRSGLLNIIAIPGTLLGQEPSRKFSPKASPYGRGPSIPPIRSARISCRETSPISLHGMLALLKGAKLPSYMCPPVPGPYTPRPPGFSALGPTAAFRTIR